MWEKVIFKCLYFLCGIYFTDFQHLGNNAVFYTCPTIFLNQRKLNSSERQQLTLGLVQDSVPLPQIPTVTLPGSLLRDIPYLYFSQQNLPIWKNQRLQFREVLPKPHWGIEVTALAKLQFPHLQCGDASAGIKYVMEILLWPSKPESPAIHNPISATPKAHGKRVCGSGKLGFCSKGRVSDKTETQKFQCFYFLVTI